MVEHLYRGARDEIFHFLSRNWLGGGVSFYGRRDAQVDGRYTTTRWYTILYVPLFPVDAYVVQDGPQTDSWSCNQRCRWSNGSASASWLWPDDGPARGAPALSESARKPWLMHEPALRPRVMSPDYDRATQRYDPR